MTARSALESARTVLVDPRDASKTTATFFEEMPWNGPREADPRQWPAARFLQLLCAADKAELE